LPKKLSTNICKHSGNCIPLVKATPNS
jgi:hypothetical protein